MTAQTAEQELSRSPRGPQYSADAQVDPSMERDASNSSGGYAAAPTDTPGDSAGLLRRLAAGDCAAWYSVVTGHQSRLGALGRGYRLTPQEVEDAVQKTWLLLLTHADQVRDPECLGGWLTTTMRHECLRLLKGRREEPVGDWSRYEAPSVSSEDPEARLEALEERRLARELWDLAEELPTRQRVLLRALFSVDEPSYAEVSARAGLPIGAIGPTRQRALRRLRDLFEEGDARLLA
jgi:RNA polymerase sigma factor (sigma-70 family)